MMHTSFFPYSFSSRTAGLSHPVALCKPHYDLKRDSFQGMPAEAAREFASMERRTNTGRAVSEQPAGDTLPPHTASRQVPHSQATRPGSMSSLREPR